MASLEYIKHLWALEMAARNKPAEPKTPYERQVAASAAAHEQGSSDRVLAKTDRVQVSWKGPSPTIALLEARERLAEEGRTAHLRGSPNRITADSNERVSRTDDEPAEAASALRELTQEAAWQAAGHVEATPVSAKPLPGPNFSTVDLRRVQQVRESREAHLHSPTRLTATRGPDVKPSP